MKILIFASLREALNADSIELEIDLPVTVAELKQQAASLVPAIDSLHQQQALLVAVNQVIASDDARITNSDEVAFFPPVTGG